MKSPENANVRNKIMIAILVIINIILITIATLSIITSIKNQLNGNIKKAVNDDSGSDFGQNEYMEAFEDNNIEISEGEGFEENGISQEDNSQMEVDFNTIIDMIKSGEIKLNPIVFFIGVMVGADLILLIVFIRKRIREKGEKNR